MTSSGPELDASWSLTPEGVEACGGVTAKAVHLDLRDHGAPCIPEEIIRGKADTFTGTVVLQITKIRNVAAPKLNEESGAAPRMLKLSLTDGHAHCHALEVAKLDEKGISLSTPPGSKVRLTGPIPLSPTGFLLLDKPGCIESLGGKVAGITDKWELQRKMAHFTRATRNRPSAETAAGGGEGPPPWIPFGKKILGGNSDKENKAEKEKESKAKDNSEGRETSNPKEKIGSKIDKANGEFDSQRQDAIKEALSKDGHGTKKVFGGGTKEIKEKGKKDKDAKGSKKTDKEGGSPVSKAKTDVLEGTDEARGQSKRDRGTKGGGKGKGSRNGPGGKEDDYGQAKPAAGVSLFDFLEEKFPGAEEPTKDNHGGKKPSSAPTKSDRAQTTRESGRRRGERSGPPSSENGGKKEADHQKPRKDDTRKDRANRRDRDATSGQGNQQSSRNSQPGDPPSRKHHHDRDDNEGRSGARGGGRGGSTRQNREGGRTGSGRDFGEWSNSTYHNATAQRLQGKPANPHQDHYAASGSNPQQNAYVQKQHQQQLLESMKSMNLQDLGKPQNHHQDAVANSGGFDPYPGYANGNTANFKHQAPVPLQPPKEEKRRWKEGDVCLAKYWEDELFYPTKITALSNKNTAVVLFLEYGNFEEVLLQDIMPLDSPRAMNRGNPPPPQQQQQQGGFIPTTPGLPPAFPQTY